MSVPTLKTGVADALITPADDVRTRFSEAVMRGYDVALRDFEAETPLTHAMLNSPSFIKQASSCMCKIIDDTIVSMKSEFSATHDDVDVDIMLEALSTLAHASMESFMARAVRATL
jgi:hypothetical protein